MWQSSVEHYFYSSEIIVIILCLSGNFYNSKIIVIIFCWSGNFFRSDPKAIVIFSIQYTFKDWKKIAEHFLYFLTSSLLEYSA